MQSMGSALYGVETWSDLLYMEQKSRGQRRVWVRFVWSVNLEGNAECGFALWSENLEDNTECGSDGAETGWTTQSVGLLYMS